MSSRNGTRITASPTANELVDSCRATACNACSFAGGTIHRHTCRSRSIVSLSGLIGKCAARPSTFVFARDDDYFFGVLHSRTHEVWALRHSHRVMASSNDPTYNTTTCFETFPFPWPPGQEPADDPRVEAIAQATRELVQLRDAWLNPPGASDAGATGS